MSTRQSSAKIYVRVVLLRTRLAGRFGGDRRIPTLCTKEEGGEREMIRNPMAFFLSTLREYLRVVITVLSQRKMRSEIIRITLRFRIAKVWKKIKNFFFFVVLKNTSF